VSGGQVARTDGFVHVADGHLVDGGGRPLLMRGVGLGGWLLPEGYMWGLPTGAPQSPRQIEAFVTDLVGEDAADRFWTAYRARFITEADVTRIAAEGFDHVRLPMNARLLLHDTGVLRADGIAPVDQLVTWCRRHGIRVVLDLHGAPGGQTGTNIDDSPRGLPDLFIVGGAYRKQTIELWTALAARYRDEPVIAAYDLLNEPLPHEHADRYTDDLVDLYRELTRAIRSIDGNHVLSYEGTRWATDWSAFTQAWDPNSLLQFHKYWSPPDRPSIARFVEIGHALGLPTYMGEGGENDVDWLATAFGMYEDLGISWNLWPWKKLATWTSPMSIVPPPGWEGVVAFAAGDARRPTRVEANAALGGLLEAIAIDACEPRPDVVAAVFHRVPIRLAPETFGFGGEGTSWWTQDGRPSSGFRTDDRVTIRRAGGAEGDASFGPSDAPGRPVPRFEVELAAGDWLEYRIEVREASRLVIELASSVADAAAPAPALHCDDMPIDTTVRDGIVRGTSTSIVGAGSHKLRIEGRSAGTLIRWLEISPVDETA
jgi:endoglucanase